MVNLLGRTPQVGNLANYSRDDLRSKFKQASAVATLQELLGRLSIQCFHKCVHRPEDSLDSRERCCISMCMDRYMDSYKLVARAYSNRLQAELKQNLKEQAEQDEAFVGHT